MKMVITLFNDSLYFYVILIIVTFLIIAFHEKAGILIKKIAVKIKNIVTVSFKIQAKKNKKTTIGVKLSETQIKKSKISTIEGNVSAKDVQIEESEIGKIKG